MLASAAPLAAAARAASGTPNPGDPAASAAGDDASCELRAEVMAAVLPYAGWHRLDAVAVVMTAAAPVLLPGL